MYDFLKDKTALYVEDEKDVLQNISELLSHFFGVFYGASDGKDGYDLFLEHEIDVLLVDIELPKMNGIELIRKIRQTHKDIPVVIISAYTKTDYLLDSIELKLDQYIVKPLTSKKIHILLDKLNKFFLNDNFIELSAGVFVDKHSLTISFGDVENSLSKKEMQALVVLSHFKAIDYDEIDALWEDEAPSQNAVRSFIRHLRKKLPENLLKNRNGFGYYIENNA